MAGHKGYALAMMIEMFSGVLSGAGIGSEVGSMYKDLDRAQNVGHFFLVMDIEAFMPCDQFVERVDTTIDKLKKGRKRRGIEEIFIPGERSARIASENNSLGVPISRETISEIEEWCSKLSVAFPLSSTECRDTCAIS